MKLLASIILTSSVISSVANAQAINCQGLTDNKQRLISIHGETYIGSQILVTEQKSLGKNLPAFKTVNQMPFIVQDIEQTENGVAIIGTAANKYFAGANAVEMKLFVPSDINEAAQLSTRIENDKAKSKDLIVHCALVNDGGLSLERGDMVVPMASGFDRPTPPRPVTLED